MDIELWQKKSRAQKIAFALIVGVVSALVSLVLMTVLVVALGMFEYWAYFAGIGVSGQQLLFWLYIFYLVVASADQRLHKKPLDGKALHDFSQSDSN